MTKINKSKVNGVDFDEIVQNSKKSDNYNYIFYSKTDTTLNSAENEILPI